MTSTPFHAYYTARILESLTDDDKFIPTFSSQDIEVYHPWNKDGQVSEQRAFGIMKANSIYEKPDEENKYERQNDLYIFCVVNGNTREESNPLNLNNWDFYIVPTSVINEKCKDNKTISLSRIQNMGYRPFVFSKIKEEVYKQIEAMK